MTMGHLGQSVARAGGDPLLVDVIVDHDTGAGRRDALLRPLVTKTKHWDYLFKQHIVFVLQQRGYL